MLRNKVKEKEHLDIYGELREEIGMKTYLHGPMETTRKRRNCELDLDLQERRGVPVVEGRTKMMHICALVSKQ